MLPAVPTINSAPPCRAGETERTPCHNAALEAWREASFWTFFAYKALREFATPQRKVVLGSSCQVVSSSMFPHCCASSSSARWTVEIQCRTGLSLDTPQFDQHGHRPCFLLSWPWGSMTGPWSWDPQWELRLLEFCQLKTPETHRSVRPVRMAKTR